MDTYYFWQGKGIVKIIVPPNWKAPSRKRNCVVEIVKTGELACRPFRGLRKIVVPLDWISGIGEE